MTPGPDMVDDAVMPAPVTGYRPLIDRLEAWQVHDTIGDRELADQVLLADGWTIERNDNVRGRVLWRREGQCRHLRFESARPNPIINFVAARAMLPRHIGYSLTYGEGGAMVQIFAPGTVPTLIAGSSPAETVAFLIAVFRYREFVLCAALLQRAAGAA